jgi:hypothetical protein
MSGEFGMWNNIKIGDFLIFFFKTHFSPFSGNYLENENISRKEQCVKSPCKEQCVDAPLKAMFTLGIQWSIYKLNWTIEVCDGFWKAWENLTKVVAELWEVGNLVINSSAEVWIQGWL